MNISNDDDSNMLFVPSKEDDEENNDEQQEDDEDRSNTNKFNKTQTKKKVFMPQQYTKSKKMLTKIVNSYFNDLKEEYLRRGGSIYCNVIELRSFIRSMYQYCGLRSKEKSVNFTLDMKSSEQQTKKKKQYRNGIFSYICQSSKIVNFTLQSRVNIIPIQKPQNIKLPQLATPIPFQKDIFFLDSCYFDHLLNVFIPSQIGFKISADNKIKKLPNPPIFNRAKCGIVKDQEWIYLLGGYITKNKIITNTCERFNAKSLEYEQIEPMKNKHTCPSACLINGEIYVFSRDYIQCYTQNTWINIKMPFGCEINSFQYNYPISSTQIIMFGGMSANKKIQSVQIYNTVKNSIDSFGDILPQGICNERSWGPCCIANQIVCLSNLQASVYPHVGVKSSMAQIIYVGGLGCYLNQIVTV